MERKSFKFYRSYYDIFNELPDKDKIAFIDALFKKQFFNIEPQLSGMARLAYISQKQNIDSQVFGFQSKWGELECPEADPEAGGEQGGEADPEAQSIKDIKNKRIKDIKNKRINGFDFKKSLIELCIDEKIIDDYLLVRKNKKTVNTETAFNSIKSEIEKSGISANDCIKIAVEKSWAGFKADWIKDLKPSQDETIIQTDTNGKKINRLKEYADRLREEQEMRLNGTKQVSNQTLTIL